MAIFWSDAVTYPPHHTNGQDILGFMMTWDVRKHSVEGSSQNGVLGGIHNNVVPRHTERMSPKRGVVQSAGRFGEDDPLKLRQ